MIILIETKFTLQKEKIKEELEYLTVDFYSFNKYLGLIFSSIRVRMCVRVYIYIYVTPSGNKENYFDNFVLL